MLLHGVNIVFIISKPVYFPKHMLKNNTSCSSSCLTQKALHYDILGNSYVILFFN